MTHICKPAIIVRLAVWIWAAATLVLIGHAGTRPPNVVFILTDDQGAMDAGCYGAEDLTTPSIDSLARRGVRFTQFYSAAPVCSPSRAAILTGRYPWRAGVPSNVGSQRGSAGMPSEQITLAEMLGAAGYTTAHIGKWHLGYSPQTMPKAQGFDHSFGHMGGCIDNYSHFFYWSGPNTHDLHRNGQEVHLPGRFFPDLMVEEAVGFMQQNRHKPFFIYFALNQPHYPYQGEPQWLEHYAALPYPRNLYAAFLSTMDQRIGSLLRALDDLGLREQTLVILQSDNGHSTEERAHRGGGSAGPYRGAKFSLFEGGIRLPAIISWPGHIPAGVVRDQVVHACDWFPTIADLCGVRLPHGDLDGRSLVEVLASAEAPSPHDVLYWQTGPVNRPEWAVRQGPWKLLGNPRDTGGEALPAPDRDLFLVHLDTDLGETNNLAGRRPEIVGRMLRHRQVPETRQATGVRIGEVTQNSAFIWTRITQATARRNIGIEVRGRPGTAPDRLPDRAELRGACPGAEGRVRLRISVHEDMENAQATDWVSVDAASDFSHTFRLDTLEPATTYTFAVDTTGPAGFPVHESFTGRFRTAPAAEDTGFTTRFCVVTGQMYQDLDHEDGFQIYPTMERMRPDFIVLTGDNVYYDNEAPKAVTPTLARYHWERMYSLPRHVDLMRRIPVYWEKDDHDTLKNDCWPGQVLGDLTFAEGQRIFQQQTPAPDVPYRTFRWGKALQVWLTEGRDFRSPNTLLDAPEKTIWGAEQRAWLKKTLLASDATWKVLVSPTPIVGPDRPAKNDNHANQGFANEGDEIRRWIQAYMGDNFFIACGDRHWQYHSVDPETGVHEFSCGPASDRHAGGSPGEQSDYHRFHKVQGGFLSIEASVDSIVFRLHGVHGETDYQYTRAIAAP